MGMVVNDRGRDLVGIDVMQFGFMLGSRTTDPLVIIQQHRQEKNLEGTRIVEVMYEGEDVNQNEELLFRGIPEKGRFTSMYIQLLILFVCGRD